MMKKALVKELHAIDSLFRVSNGDAPRCTIIRKHEDFVPLGLISH